MTSAGNPSSRRSRSSPRHGRQKPHPPIPIAATTGETYSLVGQLGAPLFVADRCGSSPSASRRGWPDAAADGYRSVPEASGEVALADVVEEGHESAAAQAPRDSLDAGHVRAGRLAHEQSGSRKPHAHSIFLVDADRDALVDQHLVENRGHDVLGAAERLEPLHAGKRLGDDADEPDRRIVLLEAPAQAGQGAAGPDADDDVRDAASGLLQDLDRRRLVVRPPVVLVAVLIAEEVVVRVGLVAAAHLAERLVVAEERIGERERCAVGEHPLLALGARVVGDHDLDRDSDDPPDHRVGDARVARRAVEHGLAGLELAVVERAQEHPQHGPVLERAPGVQRLHLREHLDVRQLAAQHVDRHERRVADRPQHWVTIDQRLDSRIPGHAAYPTFPEEVMEGHSISAGDEGPVGGRPRRMRGAQGPAGRRALGVYLFAYSNFGAAFSASLVAPCRTILPICCLNFDTGTAISCSPMPRNPPTPTIAYDKDLLGATIRSLISPIFSPESL